MTALTKLVRRRPITVELVPPFTLRFRELGRRVSYDLTVQEAFTAAAKLFYGRQLVDRVARGVSRG